MMETRPPLEVGPRGSELSAQDAGEFHPRSSRSDNSAIFTLIHLFVTRAANNITILSLADARPCYPIDTPMLIKILLVEDEPSIAEIVQFALASEGFQTTWRASAAEAETALTAQAYDLVVLDLGLPDGSGLEVLKRLRRVSEVPVIILSARDAELDRVLGLELGADDFIGKPFSPRELAARVKAILKRANRSSAAIEAATADHPNLNRWFELDEPRASISFRGRPLALTRYEYLLLKTLLAQPERVFSRAQLMDGAWPDPAASFERSVDTHIKTLRAKLREIDPSVDPIRTHRGLGYSLRTGDAA